MIPAALCHFCPPLREAAQVENRQVRRPGIQLKSRDLLRNLREVRDTERIHLFACDDDHFFRPELVTDMWDRWGKPTIQWYPGSHMGFLANLPDAVRRLRTFADERVA